MYRWKSILASAFAAALFGPVLSWAAAPTVSSPTVSTLATNASHVLSYSGYINGESFQQDGITAHNGYEYAAYWTTGRQVVLGRRALPSGAWQKITFTDYTSNTDDSHNVICIGICKADGTIHLAFDMHGNNLRYRKSVAGLATNPGAFSWTASQFSPVQSHLNGTTLTLVTYPAFIDVPDGRLQLAYRYGSSGSGDEVLYEYSNGTWQSLGKFIDGITSSKNAYLFGIEYDRFGRLHMTWNWRDTPDASSNHDLLYAYSTDYGRTWRNNAGTLIATTGSTFIKPSTPGTVVWGIPTNRGLINQESQIVDSNGVVHVIASHLPDGAPSNSNFNTARQSAVIFHYFRNTNGTWQKRQTPFLERLSRSDVAVDSQNNLYVASGDSSTHRLHVETASAASGWSDWTLRWTSSSIYFSDPLIDRPWLLSNNRLAIFSPRYNSGTIDVLTFTVTPDSTPDAYQSESGVAAGGVTIDSNNAGYNGTGFANFPATGGTLTFNNVDGSGGGTKALQIRYALGAAGSRTGTITVNGVTSNITFNSTGSWSTWQTMTVNITLENNSTNTIRFASTGQDLGNIDEIALPSTPAPTPDTYQGESGAIGGGVTVDSNNAGFNGTGFVNFPTSGGTLTFNNVDGNGGGTKSLAIRYALGATSARTGTITVNGVTSNITFNPTGSWTTWQTMNVNITLNDNSTNTIQFTSTGQDLGNIDQITVP